ncbi:MAG: flavodoxin [Clostridium sp.]|uniref:flavodoxin family protein n=1 Tax=Clostridium sp. TaxID=1506 RepID=UPI00304247BD
MSNTLVVFYSLDGNSKLIGEEIKNILNCDILELKPIKDLNPNSFKLSKYLWGGKQIIMNKAPELNPYTIDLKKYDNLFIGSPIWAGTYAPALKTFFIENEIKDKNIGLYCCHGGGSSKGIFANFEKELNPNNEILGKIEFQDPLTLSKDDSKLKLHQWVNSLKLR